MNTQRPIDNATLHKHLGDDAADRLVRYFCTTDFTGRSFERLAGGGDRRDTADRFTADDIVAVSLLGLRISGRAALQLLDEQQAESTERLARIPADLDLWDASDAHIGPSSDAVSLWDLLVKTPGIGWVTAGKLLARKRPRLIPVYDRVVRAALGRPNEESWWLPLRDVLRDDRSIVDRLLELRTEAKVGDDISLLRILDVAIWMGADGERETVRDPET